MQNYCERDTLVTRELVLRLKKAGYSRMSLDNEHELALYLNEMEENGWPFDMDKATALQAKLAGKRELAGQRLRDIFGQLYVRNGGKEFVPKRDDKVRGYYKDAPSCKIKPVDFNPASRDHIADRLIKLYGWKPETFTDGGKPELDEDTINALPYSEAKDIAEYLLIDKRLGFLSEGKQALITHSTNERPLGGKLTGSHTSTHASTRVAL
jgi:DNA polymerase-1